MIMLGRSLVVLYRFSTSNHNLLIYLLFYEKVVLYRFSTSNHNSARTIHSQNLLYYIVSLHQTTTTLPQVCMRTLLYYIVSLHQTTTWYVLNSFHSGCIISFLYIKPQLCEYTPYQRLVVLYRFSTSNHNKKLHRYSLYKLYYIVSLHQTTTERHDNTLVDRCIISFLYIKPQLKQSHPRVAQSCIISFLYIKPQLPAYHGLCVSSCIISFLYIKPQRYDIYLSPNKVVLYRFSTSNHNETWHDDLSGTVVLYRFSTSNHN